jgi:hypothetical protein
MRPNTLRYSDLRGLPTGTPLQILEEHNGWYHVKLEQEGWVKKEHVRI